MKPKRKILLASAGAIAAIGVAGAAAAAISQTHVLMIRLPDGSQEQIRYWGDTPPQVRLQPLDGAAFAALAPTDLFGPGSPFAELERVSHQMDQEEAALLRQVGGMATSGFTHPDGLMQVDLSRLPAGVSGYSMVSTLSGGQVCTRTTEYGRVDGSARPRAVTRVSGDCGVMAGPSSSTLSAAPPEAAARPQLQQVSERY